MSNRDFRRLLALSGALLLCNDDALAARKYTSIFRDATVWRDVDGDEQFDSNEKYRKTNSDGNFLPPPGKKGTLVLKGGYDIVTGAYNARTIALESGLQAKAGTDNDQTVIKPDQATQFAQLMQVWEYLNREGYGSQAPNITGIDFSCMGLRAFNDCNLTPKPNKGIDDMGSKEVQARLAEGQLSTMIYFIENQARRIQLGKYFDSETEPARALALALFEVYTNQAQTKPDLTRTDDVQALFENALQIIGVKYLTLDRDVYASQMPDIVHVATGLTDNMRRARHPQVSGHVEQPEDNQSESSDRPVR